MDKVPFNNTITVTNCAAEMVSAFREWEKASSGAANAQEHYASASIPGIAMAFEGLEKAARAREQAAQALMMATAPTTNGEVSDILCMFLTHLQSGFLRTEDEDDTQQFEDALRACIGFLGRDGDIGVVRPGFFDHFTFGSLPDRLTSEVAAFENVANALAARKDIKAA